MSAFRPSSQMHDDTLTIHLCDAQTQSWESFEGVLDLTYLGEIIGIEILGLSLQLNGGHVLKSTGSGFPRWSYDDEVDALYIRITEGPGQVQATVFGRASLDASGGLIALEIAVPQ